MIQQIALVSLTPRLALGQVAQVAAALNKQITRDFGPLWQQEATVDVFERLDDKPPDYWAVTIEDLGPNVVTGVHGDLDLQPFARVAYSNMWPLSASHEILEMLLDPFGNHRVAGPHPEDAAVRVEYLVEISDPCQDPRYAYTVNGFLLSDFVTRAYYQPDQSDAVRYSFCGHVERPRQVLPGGYLAWKDPAQDGWFQFARDATGRRSIRPITLSGAMGMSLRERVDAASPERAWTRGVPRDDESLVRARNARRAASHAARGAAKTFRNYLAELDRRPPADYGGQAKGGPGAVPGSTGGRRAKRGSGRNLVHSARGGASASRKSAR